MGAVAAVYFGAARLGLALGVVEQVTVVWPPTGIALAALLLFGYRAWPGVALGAFLANALAPGETIPTACGIAVGNTLEALAGAWLLRRLGGFRGPLDRLRDVLGLVLLAAALSTTLSATVGVASLCLGGVHPWSAFGALWWVWWLGDAMGNLVVAPLLLTWAAWPPARWGPWRRAEAAALLAALVAVCLVALAGAASPEGAHHPLEYAVFPLVIWAALRFGPAGTAVVTAAASGIAIGGTLQGSGPFAGVGVGEPLILLQVFMGVVAVTGLVLAAATAERDAGARHRAAAYAVTQALADSATLGEATSRILPTVCGSLGWDYGALWTVDPGAGVLHCAEVWRQPALQADEFEADTRQRTFPPGVGLPGRVWASGKPAWVPDVVQDDNFPRAPAAARAGLHGAFGFPVLAGTKVLGVIEFFSRQPREPDQDLLQLMAALGGQVGLVLERRRADAALRHSHDVLRAVTEGTTDAVFVKDLAGRYLMINQAGAQFLGKTVEEVLGRDDAELFTPEAARAVMERDHQVMVAEQTHTFEEVGSAAGVTRTFLSAKGPYRDERGKVIGLIGISRDITDRKRMEGELLQRARDLAEAARQKDEFLAMLAHELRNPLAPIRNAAEVLRLLGAADPQLRWAREVIERQVQQLTRLVDDLLDVSRITRGKVRLRREPLELAAVVARAVETSRPLIDARRHELAVALPAGPVWLEADPTRLAQVVANLLNNAAKYTEEGGRIWLAAEAAGGEVVLRVRDTGIGIPAEMLPKVFDLFTQVDRGLDRSQGGLGIGLTLVRSLVAMHGGTVEAHSPGPGRGSEFVVRLPTLPGAGPPGGMPGHGARPSAAAGSRRVLVVDDNVDSAESLAVLLRLAGHEVRTAHDGPGALALARDGWPAVVLLDIGLPGMDGYAVARQVRGQPGLEGVLLVAMTGYGQEDDRQRAREAGFDHHLVKPVDLEELSRLLSAPAAELPPSPA